MLKRMGSWTDLQRGLKRSPCADRKGTHRRDPMRGSFEYRFRFRSRSPDPPGIGELHLHGLAEIILCNPVSQCRSVDLEWVKHRSFHEVPRRTSIQQSQVTSDDPKGAGLRVEKLIRKHPGGRPGCPAGNKVHRMTANIPGGVGVLGAYLGTLPSISDRILVVQVGQGEVRILALADPGTSQTERKGDPENAATDRNSPASSSVDS